MYKVYLDFIVADAFIAHLFFHVLFLSVAPLQAPIPAAKFVRLPLSAHPSGEEEANQVSLINSPKGPISQQCPMPRQGY